MQTNRIAVLAAALALMSSASLPAQAEPLELTVSFSPAAKAPDVRLATAADGYLMLFHVAGGRVRVMFPGNPSGSAALPAGTYLLESLQPEMPYHIEYGGVIVAAWSAQPIRTSEMVRYGHWAVGDLSRKAFSQRPLTATAGLVEKFGSGEIVVRGAEVGPIAGAGRRAVQPALRQDPDLARFGYPKHQRGRMYLPPCGPGSRPVSDGYADGCITIVRTLPPLRVESRSVPPPPPPQPRIALSDRRPAL